MQNEIPLPKPKQWFALYTKPRWEKKVNEMLLAKNVEAWCPIQKVKKQWKDRKKIVEEPLFKSYVFVHVNYTEERLNVLTTDGVLNFVHWLNKPAIIKDEEVALIKKYLNDEKAKIDIISSQGFQVDTKVRVNHGIFMENEGVVLRSGKKRVYVQLLSLGQVMVVEFSAECLTPIY